MKRIESLEPKPQLKFSDGTRQLMIRAAESAFSLNDNYVGTEHLLLVLLEDPLIAGFIKTFPNGDPERIKNSVLSIIGGGRTAPSGEGLYFTPLAKSVISLATSEARMQGKAQIEPSDILLGLIQEKAGIAAHILNDIGMKPDDIVLIKKNLKNFLRSSRKTIVG